MDEFLLGVGAGLVVLGGVAVVAYVALRRVFERASAEAADRLGEVIAELSGRAAESPFGRRTASAARAAGARFTRLDAYAAAHGMSEEDARREFRESIERVARLMDSAIHVPIIGPVGLDPALGLFPVAGDVVSATISLLLISRSIRYGVPREIIARMLANVLFDLLAGALPVVGDLADVWFRANQRNVALLREYLEAEAHPIIDITPEPAGDAR